MSITAAKSAKLNATSALVTTLLYLVGSIFAGLLAVIVFGGLSAPEDGRNIDGVIDSGMLANLIVLAGLLYVSLWVFKESRKDIFIERQSLALPNRYYLFPLVWCSITLFVLTQVDYTAFSVGVILLVLVASIAIGANEEIVTRGILLVGLRNSGVVEWLVWLISTVIFALLHLVNVLGGMNLTILLVTLTGGTLLYVSRRVFGNLFVPIALHAIYDTAFYLFTGSFSVNETLPDPILDVQLSAFLVLSAATVLFLIYWARS